MSVEVDKLRHRLSVAEQEAERWKEAWLSRGRRINGVGEFADEGPWEPVSVRVEKVALVERERDEAREALTAARAEADMWHKIAESRLDERDQAREALRELVEALHAVDITGDDQKVERAYAARYTGAGVLEGVERTHALVPLPMLRDAASLIDELGRAAGHGGDRHPLAESLDNAARGEHPVQWPEDQR